jgi:hypothetical protein
MQEIGGGQEGEPVHTEVVHTALPSVARNHAWTGPSCMCAV